MGIILIEYHPVIGGKYTLVDITTVPQTYNALNKTIGHSIIDYLYTFSVNRKNMTAISPILSNYPQNRRTMVNYND